MKKIYFLSTCSTSQRIMKELDLTGFEKQEIKSEPITAVQLKEMQKLAGSYESLFSRRAMKYRQLGLNEKQLTEQDYHDWILKEYTFLKRPVIIVDGEIFIGSSKKTVEAVKERLTT